MVKRWNLIIVAILTLPSGFASDEPQENTESRRSVLKKLRFRNSFDRSASDKYALLAVERNQQNYYTNKSSRAETNEDNWSHYHEIVNGERTMIRPSRATIGSDIAFLRRSMVVQSSIDLKADKVGHGTHVLGTVSAADNNIGVVGVAPGAKIHMVRVIDDYGFFRSSDLVEAMIACKEAEANVINLSLGGRRFSVAEHRMIDDFMSNGILVVATAGNTGMNDNSPLYPGSYS